jgi:AcrR family transcriptional regulator
MFHFFGSLQANLACLENPVFPHCFFHAVMVIISLVVGFHRSPMPRHPDPRLENRILDAAYRLWARRGEDALTMRAVAKAAGTTTPTVYHRFRDKGDLVTYLEDRARENMYQSILPANSIAETCELALDFAVRHANEYQLLSSGWAARFGTNLSLPSFSLVKQRLAKELGGQPDDHVQLGLALVELVHGTAILVGNKEIDPPAVDALRRACLLACQALITPRC